MGDRVLHLEQQLVALIPAQLLVLDQRIEQDLDVDLVIRAVDPADVVHRVGIEAPAGLLWAAVARVLDPPQLREAEVAPLPNHAAAEILAVHSHRVVGLVAYVAVALGRGLYISADPAVPEQVNRRTKDRLDQLVR